MNSLLSGKTFRRNKFAKHLLKLDTKVAVFIKFRYFYRLKWTSSVAMLVASGFEADFGERQLQFLYTFLLNKNDDEIFFQKTDDGPRIADGCCNGVV